MITTGELRQYFWSIFGILGVVLFWAGVWEGLGSLPYLEKPWISLVVGLGMLTLSSFIFKDADPFWGRRKKVESQLWKVHHHAEKHHFHIRYHDKEKQKHVTLPAKDLLKIEKEFLVFMGQHQQEVFIPMHRVKEVLYKGKKYWKAG